MRRFLGIAAVGALTASGLALTGPAGAVAPQTAIQARPGITDFGLKAAAYGTKAVGGQVPANSGRTAFAWVACTRKAGVGRANHVEQTTVDPVTQATIVQSRAWTTRKNGVVSSRSRNYIAKLTIGDATSGVTIEGIRAMTRSWHSATGYHSLARTSVASITGPGGVALPIPTEGNPTRVPGVATISVGVEKARQGAGFATAKAVTLKILVEETQTRLTTGYAFSRIDGGITGGVFGGHANGSQVNALDGTVTSGRTSLQPMPCQGTDGKIKVTDTLQASLPDIATLEQVRSAVWGVQENKFGAAEGFARSKVEKARFDAIGSKTLVISGIVANAHMVRRDNGTISRDARGTVARITVNGTAQPVPGAGEVLTIEGVARISGPQIERVPSGIDVVAVTVKLLNGAAEGSIVKLGHGLMRIRPS